MSKEECQRNIRTFETTLRNLLKINDAVNEYFVNFLSSEIYIGKVLKKKDVVLGLIIPINFVFPCLFSRRAQESLASYLIERFNRMEHYETY